jgi:hypothetical protein
VKPKSGSFFVRETKDYQGCHDTNFGIVKAIVHAGHMNGQPLKEPAPIPKQISVDEVVVKGTDVVAHHDDSISLAFFILQRRHDDIPKRSKLS